MQIYRQAMAMIADAVGQSALERLVGLGFSLGHGLKLVEMVAHIVTTGHLR
jgi:hypothetical protein